MKREIGEIFRLNGEWYQCIESDSCGECSLFTTECGSGTKSDLADKIVGECSRIRRSDNKSVIFKKLEKVGKPMEFAGGVYFQRYRLVYSTAFYEGGLDLFFNAPIKTYVYIKINQNKEDMKEKKLNLKPFSLEAAKAGKPVCTRDGRKARIICWDKIGKFPIVALVMSRNNNEAVFYYNGNGRDNDAIEKDYDLMILSEKKEGWVNVDKRSNGDVIISKPYSTRDEAIHNSTELTIDTVNMEWEE